jgi:hypothetical protein
VEINEEDEKALAAFMSKGNSAQQRTLGDIILQKIREKDAEVSAGSIPFNCHFSDTLNGSPFSKLLAVLN